MCAIPCYIPLTPVFPYYIVRYMAYLTTRDTARATAPKRPWGRRTFYVSEQMALAAHRLSEAEEARTGRQVGAGQIIDRAMRRYLSELLTPEELAALLDGRGA